MDLTDWKIAVIGLFGWFLLFFLIFHMNRHDSRKRLTQDMKKAIKKGYPPPGRYAEKVCKHYRKDGPSPCQWPYCTCTKGLPIHD